MLGLSALILNAILLSVTAALTDNLDIDGLGRAIAGALVIAIVTTVLELVLRPVANAAGPPV
jgi:putative membrane protein